MFFILSQFLLEPFHLPRYPTLFSLSLKKKKIQKESTYTHTPKYTSQKPVRQSILLSSFCVAQLLRGTGLIMKYGQYTQ